MIITPLVKGRPLQQGMLPFYINSFSKWATLEGKNLLPWGEILSFKNSPLQEGKQILTDQIRVISLQDWSPGEYKEQQTKHRCVAVCALTVNVDETKFPSNASQLFTARSLTYTVVTGTVHTNTETQGQHENFWCFMSLSQLLKSY